MGNILENLTSAIENLESSVKKDLEEIRLQKLEVQQMQEAIRMDNFNMKYVHDDNCLILSAPNIIIGNVDHTGKLKSGGSNVIIRGNNVFTEATGPDGVGGIITNRATTIQNIAVDPGIDGLENAVFTNSKIVNQARAITLQSNNEEGAFSVEPAVAQGVNIISDTIVDVSALAPNKNRQEVIDGKVAILEARSSEISEAAAVYKESLASIIEQIGDLVVNQSDLNGSDDAIAANFEEVYNTQHEKFIELESLLYSCASGYVNALAEQAEAERSITALKATKEQLSTDASNFDTQGTTSSISMSSESIGIACTDGDGSIRTNASAGLYVNVPHITVTSHDQNGALITDSDVTINTQKFELSTANPTYDDPETMETGQFPASGDVIITSKNVTVQAIDQELKDDALTETALTTDSKFTLRAENIVATATDTEGNSTGLIALNAKTMNIAAMNVDKDTRADKEMATDSQLTVLAAKNLIGTTEKTTLVQLASDKIAVIAKTTAEMQQDGKAVVTLTGGNMTAGGSAVEIDGDTTIKGGAEIKGKTTTPVLTADSVTANSAFSSPNISDTQGAGTAGSASSPSATLTEEVASTTTSNS